MKYKNRRLEDILEIKGGQCDKCGETYRIRFWRNSEGEVREHVLKRCDCNDWDE